jgi:hypothetical protein
MWLPNIFSVAKLVIDITDGSNPLGYVEASRAVCGTYWEPTYNAEYGVSVGMTDTSKQERTDAGDLRTDRGTIHKTMDFDLQVMPKEDRNFLYNILRGNGMYKPLFISMTPADADSVGEQVFQVYGKLSKAAAIKYVSFNMFSTSLEIEEN